MGAERYFSGDFDGEFPCQSPKLAIKIPFLFSSELKPWARVAKALVT